MRSPKALVSWSRPTRSTRTIEVSEMKAATQSPKMTQADARSSKVGRNGVTMMVTPPTKTATTVTTVALTEGKSDNHPEKIRPLDKMIVWLGNV